jgi:ribosome-associated toxin RatA of RatAB toxin-antitoxin module
VLLAVDSQTAMKIERTAMLRAAPEDVFELVDDLGRYPQWMDLVHDVHVVPGTTGDLRSWDVELRAQVGPLARSKRLRMTRTIHEPTERVVFERSEVDGKRHSSWVLESSLTDQASGEVELTMTLTYGGNLWTGAVLERVLDDHVERGARSLAELLAAAPPESP